MFSDPDASVDNVLPAHPDVRLRMKPSTGARGYVDGGWWPRSHDPAREFPGLVLAMSSWVGPVSRVAYHLHDWDKAGRDLMVDGWPVRLAGFLQFQANTVVVTGPNQRRMSLLVVPAGTPGGLARAVLRSAAAADTIASVEEILTSNGVRTAPIISL